MIHVPVLQKEVLKYLDPKPNENFIDCTVNGGGHARAVLKKNEPQGRVLGIELDKYIYKELEIKRIGRLTLINDSYTNLEQIVEKNSFKPVAGILFDLGMSSWHIEQSGRGFSFLRDEPLDMRYNSSQELKAEDVLNGYQYQDLEKIIREYGEDKFSRRIAKNIIKARPLKTTFDLVKAIGGRKGKIHPSTRTFQALRIEVNKELDNLEKALPQAKKVLSPGGRLVVISFHSLEDRIVKNFFKKSKLDPVRNSKGNQGTSKSNRISNGIEILTKKLITPSKKEVKQNLHSRSSKLRAGIKR